MSKLLASPVAALASFAAVLLLGLGLYGWGRHDGRALEEGRAAALVAEANRKADRAEAKAEQISEDISRDYQEKLDAIRNSPIPVRVVRLCVPASSEQVRTVSDAGAIPSTVRPEPVSGAPGPDIGERLYAIADEADQCSIQRDALIDWIKAQSRASVQ